MVRPKAVAKRLIKLAVSVAVRSLDVARRAGLKVLGKTPPPSCVVLYYHAVDPRQRADFARQMDAIKELTVPIRGDWRQPLEPGRYYSVITFDDGFVSVLENALPEMEARNIPSVMFVPTGSLGGRPAWIKNPEAPAYQQQVASAEQLARLKDHPLASVQSHSVSHPNFLRLDREQAQMEMRKSREDLERITREPVTLFSFPHGKHNDQLVALAQEAGYQRVFTVEPRPALQAPDEVVTGRVAVEPTDWAWEYRLKALGAYRWLAKAG